MLKENGLATPKTIIFCSTMKDTSAVYGELISKLSELPHGANKTKSPQNRLIGTYYSMTWKKYKPHLFESFKEDNGNIRVVLASSSSYTESRAGRNGELAHNIVYNGNKISECEKTI